MIIVDRKELIKAFKKIGIKRTIYAVYRWEKIHDDFPVYSRGATGNFYDVRDVFAWFFGEKMGAEKFKQLEK